MTPEETAQVGEYLDWLDSGKTPHARGRVKAYSPDLNEAGLVAQDAARAAMRVSPSRRVLGGMVALAMAEVQLGIYWNAAGHSASRRFLAQHARHWSERDRRHMSQEFYVLRDFLFLVYTGRTGSAAYSAASRLADEHGDDHRALRSFLNDADRRLTPARSRAETAAQSSGQAALEAVECGVVLGIHAFRVSDPPPRAAWSGTAAPTREARQTMLRSRGGLVDWASSLVVGSWGGKFSTKEQREELAALGHLFGSAPQLALVTHQLRAENRPSIDVQTLEAAVVAADRIAQEGLPPTFRNLVDLVAELTRAG